MNPIQNRLDKLIEAGKEIRWEDCSYAKPEHNAEYGRATPAWNTWASRIKRQLNLEQSHTYILVQQEARQLKETIGINLILQKRITLRR